LQDFEIKIKLAAQNINCIENELSIGVADRKLD
jgi:hypothetical protein